MDDLSFIAACRRPLASTAALLLFIALGTTAFAQQPAKPDAAKPQQAPAASAPAKPPQGEQPHTIKMPPLLYSSWTKICMTGGVPPEVKQNAANGKAPAEMQICSTGIEARTETDLLFLGMATLEPMSAQAQPILRIVVPLGMKIDPGTRLVLDGKDALQSKYVTCLTVGCVTTYELTPDLLAKLKKSKSATVQAIAADDSLVSIQVPLQDFGKAHDGPATDPKVLAEMEKKREEAFQKKAQEMKAQAEEARKKLQQQQQPAKPQ